MLEGWLSSTRDILMDAYGMDVAGTDIVRTARMYLEGPARTSWDAQERSMGAGGGFTCWAEFAAWLRHNHGSAAPQIVQGQLLLRLKQKGDLQLYINKWHAISTQLPTTLPDEIAKLIFCENLDSSYHDLASQFQVAHPSCCLQDIIQYLRMVTVDSKTRKGEVPAGYGGFRQQDKEQGPVPMDVDLKSLVAQLAQLGQRLDQASTSEGVLNRLTAEEKQECMAKKLCFTCRKPGHQSERCPERKKR